MNSNERVNQANIKKFRKELEAMLGEVKEIDIRVLNKALNVGLREVKKNTPVGQYSDGRVGGTLRSRWNIKRARRIGKSVQGHLFNNVEYAPYVNYGHRIVNKNGETVGWVNGRFMLERAMARAEKTMVKEFNKEVERVRRKYDT